MSEERLAMLASITIKKSPALVVHGKHPKRHVRVIWEIKSLMR